MILEKMPEGVDFFKAVVCPIFSKDGRTIILQKRKDHPIYPGLWGFPAGKVRHGDSSVKSAVLREIKEETGNTYEFSDLGRPIVVPCRHQKLNGEYFYFLAFIYYILSDDGLGIKLDPEEHQAGLAVPWKNILSTAEKNLIPDVHETLKILQDIFRLPE